MRGPWIALLLVLLASPGCGYRVVRYSGALGDVGSVVVVTPENDSFEAGAEFVVADALRREFLRRRAVRLVEDRESADLVLSGRVLPFEGSVQSFSSVALALEYELTLTLELQAVRRDGSGVPLEARALRETERYLASADAEALRNNRQEALRRAAQVLAGRVVDALYASLTR